VNVPANLYTTLVSHVLFPLHELLKGHDTVAVRAALERSQWWSPERLREFQRSRLRTLLVHAAKHVPYYRELFRELGCEAEDIRSLEDLPRLPLLTKEIVRAHTRRMKSEIARGLARSNTGGSSGEPLVFFIGKERVSHDVAAKWRATRWWGVDIGDPEIVVWGSPIEISAQDRVRRWRDKLLRTELLSAFEMCDAKLDAFVACIRETRPKMLFGYPSALALLARHAEERGIALNDLGIVVAFVTSERLYDDQRETIGRVFGCRVANGYGGRDAGFIAHECPEGSMHITAEDIIVELVDTHGDPVPPGEAGEIVVTHLATREFPFVRYRTGDVAVLATSPCGCGRGLPALREIQGRSTDFVVAADGTVMHGLALIYVLRELSGIRQFQIVQESRELTVVRVVPEIELSEAILTRIRDGFRARLGSGVAVGIEVCEEIAPEASGKFRYVKSHVTNAEPL